MFSMSEKKQLAALIEKALLDLKHPEMPKDKALFSLHVQGKEVWSWADIKPNWTFEGKVASKQNPWNEVARDILPNVDGPDMNEEGDK